MDEFGSRIQQSCDPSVAMAVFFYIPMQLAFTVMWPLRDLDYSGGCGLGVTQLALSHVTINSSQC